MSSHQPPSNWRSMDLTDESIPQETRRRVGQLQLNERYRELTGEDMEGQGTWGDTLGPGPIGSADREVAVRHAAYNQPGRFSTRFSIPSTGAGPLWGGGSGAPAATGSACV